MGVNATSFTQEEHQERVTPESVLVETAERVGRIRDGRLVVHVHLADLLPQNRDEGHIRIAGRLFQTMVDAFQGQLFVLTNGDIVFMAKDIRQADIDGAVYRLRALFAKDPLTYAGTPEHDPFATYYDLEEQYDDFLAVCMRLNEESKGRIRDARERPPPRELTAATLGEVAERISQTDIASVVRRQPCVFINDRRIAHVVFQEFYMSIADLQRALAPDVNILSNRWLFQHLSLSLDLAVMAGLRKTSLKAQPVAYSLNLNVATVDTQEFKDFVKATRQKAGIYVEFQLQDILSDMNAFFQARDDLRAQDIATVLDGMNSLNLQFVDAELYDTDFVKVNWSNEIATDIQTVELQQALGPVGFDRVILARCDNEDAINWGLDQGIRLYQGRYLDSVVAAVTMEQCTKSARCSLAQCTQRHSIITGRPRLECGDNDKLDEFPPLHAIGGP